METTMVAHLTRKQRYWLARIRACESAGMSPADYCNKHDLMKQRFYGYRIDLRKRGIRFKDDIPVNRFTPVVTREEPKPASDPAEFHGYCQLTIKTRFINLKPGLGPNLP